MIHFGNFWIACTWLFRLYTSILLHITALFIYYYLGKLHRIIPIVLYWVRCKSTIR